MSKLVPGERRARQVEGTKVQVVHEAAPGGMKKMRCPGTHQLAIPSRAPDGTQILRTPGGTTYITKKLGRI